MGVKTSIIGVGNWAAGATAVMEGVGGSDCIGGELLDSAGNVAGWSAGAGDGDTFSISIEHDTQFLRKICGVANAKAIAHFNN